MKIILASPPSRSFNHFRPPLALIYLAGYLEKQGVQVEVVDIVIDKQVRDKTFVHGKEKQKEYIEKQILSKLKKGMPDVIGFTCYSPEYFEVLELSKKIKIMYPSVKIVVGGVHPTLHPHDFCFEKSPIDFVVIGEGEKTMSDLVKAIENSKEYRGVDGIAFYVKKEGYIQTAKRDLCQNLEEISFPAYDKIDMDYYTTASPYAIRGVLLRSMYILFSRGCPSQCTFCVAKSLRTCNGKGNYVRLREPKRVVEEIISLKRKHQIDSFYFIDDLFTIDKAKVKEFCRLLVKSKANLLWGCSSKVTTVDLSTLRFMKKAGCVQIDFGVERGSDEALNLVKKGTTVKIIKKAFNDCRKLRIRTLASMLVNLPQETEKDLKDILALLREIKPTITTINTFIPYPGTEIFSQHSERFSKDDLPNLMGDPGILVKDIPEKYRFCLHNVDIKEWAIRYTRKYNQVVPNLNIYFSKNYILTFLRSKRKKDYLQQIGLLFKEFINQKFGAI